MSDTEAMDISPIGSNTGDSGIPGIDKVPEIINQNLTGGDEQTASPAGDASSMRVEVLNPQFKSGIRPRDDPPGQIDPNERPLKRARTLDSQPTMNTEINQAEPSMVTEFTEENAISQSSALTPDQQAHCERLLNSICKLTAAGPFLEPVDPILAKAPDYYQVITQPMDLGTIDKKLKSRGNSKRFGLLYADLQEFVDDVNLVFDNCFKYNGSTHAISQLAIRVKDAFEEGMRTAPGGQDLKFIPITVAAVSSAHTLFSPGVGQVSQSINDLTLKTASPPGPPAPKRRHTAIPRTLPPTNLNVRSRRDPLRIAQEKFCKATLDHLYRAEYETWALPFLGPVDLNAYPEYLRLINNPMDLGTISDKLSHGAYATAEDFQKDVKLVFSNCYAFNPTWAPVYDCAKKMEAAFDEKWKELPLTVPENTAPPKPKRSSTGSAVPTRTHITKSTASRQHSKKRPVLTSLNEEQQFSLCETLSTLPDQKMDQVIALIRKRMPQFRDNKEEQNLTIENIPASVQAEMFEFLKRPRGREEGPKRERASSESSSLSSFASDDGISSDGSEKGM